ncbi:corrinoid protein [Sporomusa malonica]|uniref:Trimethylamine corrinoid protein n=1 Tax=Sporomusa malonica TaxID=112901 RepID=A0A1W2BEE4_9FIRM|nr:corrinoid protein [Sporomusa malonica]SMC71161.1 trimethylamine corrinoid protein [Sporomusa malonica]
MRPDKILKRLKKSVEEMEVSLAERAAKAAIAAGTDPVIAINEGLAKGMKTVSDLFDEGEAFIPHLLVAAEAFETGAAILTDSMSQEGKARTLQGKVLIFTVQGDIHDIGKNIVKTMLLANGFQVIDLGRDVTTAEAVEKAKEYAVDIIVAAALMRTTMPAQREILQALEEEGIRGQFKCMFGGSPVSAEWVKKIGGDAYAESASEAVEKAKELMGEIRSLQCLAKTHTA